MGTKRKRSSFISVKEFDEIAAKNKRNDYKKWSDIPLNTIYKVEDVKKIAVTRNGKPTSTYIAELRSKSNEISITWLPEIVTTELNEFDNFHKEQIYICSYGLCFNKKATRKYYHFDIVKRR